MDEKNNGLQLSGESDDMESFSRQVATFENDSNKKYVKSIGTLNSSLGGYARVEFSMSITLNQDIFSYIANTPAIAPEEAPVQQPVTPAAVAPATANPPAVVPQTPAVKSKEKSITSFHFILNHDVAGKIDGTNFTITLNVDYGTDIKNLTPTIAVSAGAKVLPASGVSQDFTNPVTYTVIAEDGSIQNYVV